jgi:hypothetical protein
MSVTGYLALYTTLLGWQQYNNLWNIAVGTGLIYLPFIAIILSATIKPFISMGAKDAAQIAIRRLTIEILSAFLIILFAAQPTVLLDPKVLHFAPICTDSSQAATPGHTGTTYDNSFSVPTGVKVPIFWYLVMAFSNGITQAASEGLPCSPLDLRELHTQLDTTQITDPKVKQELGDFYADCYLPSYSAYLSGNLSREQKNAIQDSLKTSGQSDIGWLGSQTFLNVSGFYDAHNAQKPQHGFLFDSERDAEEGQVSNHSQWGNPDCKSWWNDSENGLQNKLKKSLPVSFWQKLLNAGGNTQQTQDAVIKTLLTHTAGNQSISDDRRGYESLNDDQSGMHDFFSRYIGAPLGVGLESFSFFPKLHLLINALPVIQGSLLFALYAFLGLAIPFSRYRIGFCVTGSVFLFSVIFCSFLWNLTAWFDNELIQALYPSLGHVAGLGILDANSSGDTNKLFVDMIIGLLYIAFPLFWMAVMSWAGYQAGSSAMSFFSHLSSPANSVSAKAGGTAMKHLP